MHRDELADIEERFDRSSGEDKLRLIERLVRRLRLGAMTDLAAVERQVQEMAADPDIQRELGSARG